jgi:prepilin-type N-terminal cleavage/methylation domain-containing protein/prepilin-type processing-associated H-X9-DG protein
MEFVVVAEDTPMRTRKAAFTLVELLVVIGIIAVLIGILLPALNRAREKGRQAQCLSNVRQISMAFFMYANENKGWFPAPAVFGGGLGSQNVSNMSPTWIGRDEDWIAWRNKQPDDPLEGAIIPYLGNASPSVMRCPSDELNRTEIDVFGGPFVYSYNMNSYLSFGTVYHPASASPNTQTPDTGGPTPNTSGWNNIRAANRWGVAWKIQQVRNSSDKIIVYEVDERFLKDGRAQMQNPPVGNGNQVNYISMVSIRHDSQRVNPDKKVIGPNKLTGNPDPNNDNNNPDRRGNCGFVDGHADFISRREAHSDAHYIPRL